MRFSILIQAWFLFQLFIFVLLYALSFPVMWAVSGIYESFSGNLNNWDWLTCLQITLLFQVCGILTGYIKPDFNVR